MHIAAQPARRESGADNKQKATKMSEADKNIFGTRSKETTVLEKNGSRKENNFTSLQVFSPPSSRHGALAL